MALRDCCLSLTEGVYGVKPSKYAAVLGHGSHLLACCWDLVTLGWLYKSFTPQLYGGKARGGGGRLGPNYAQICVCRKVKDTGPFLAQSESNE